VEISNMTRVARWAALVAGAVLAPFVAIDPAVAADPAAEAAQGYTVEGSATPPSLAVGEKGKLVVVIKPKAPVWHVDPRAPVKVRFTAPAGLKVERPDLGRRDVADPKAEAPRFETSFVAASPGKQEVRAELDFFLCSDTACVKQVRSVPLTVQVR
jgi:hypothetical protein